MSFIITVSDYSEHSYIVRFTLPPRGSELSTNFEKTVKDMKEMGGMFGKKYAGGAGWLFKKKEPNILEKLIQYAKANSIGSAVIHVHGYNDPNGPVTTIPKTMSEDNPALTSEYQSVTYRVLKPVVGKYLNLTVSGYNIPIFITSVNSKNVNNSTDTGHIQSATFEIGDMERNVLRLGNINEIILDGIIWKLKDYNYQHIIGAFR